jgi:hypothetical protein
MLRQIFPVLGYVLYGLAAFAVFVYIMFPYDLLRDRVIEQASQGDIDLKIAHLGPTFPPGLAVRDAQVVMRQGNAASEVFRLQSLRARPQWLSLLSSAKGLTFNGRGALFTPSAIQPLAADPVPCDDLSGDVELRPREWRIKAFTCQGADIWIKLRGAFRLRDSWAESEPNLRIEMRSESAFRPYLELLSQWALGRSLGDNSELKFGLGGPLSNIRAMR